MFKQHFQTEHSYQPRITKLHSSVVSKTMTNWIGKRRNFVSVLSITRSSQGCRFPGRSNSRLFQATFPHRNTRIRKQLDQLSLPSL